MPRTFESKYLSRKNTQESWDTALGVVTKVFEHDGTEDEFSNHEVNVQLIHRAEEFKRIPVHADHEGSVYVPQVDDAVEVGFIQSNTQSPFVANVVYTDETRPPLARSGHFRRKFGPDDGLGSDNEYLFFEAEPKDHTAGDPDVLRMASKEDGISNPTMAIEIDDSGDDTIASIRKNADAASEPDQFSELSMGIDEADDPKPSAYIGADTDDDGSAEVYIDVREDGFIEISNDQSTNIDVVHQGSGDITVDHSGTGGISVTNSNQGDISVTNNSPGNVTIAANNGKITSSSSDEAKLESTAANTTVSASTNAQLKGNTVTLGGGGKQIIKDIAVNTTEDSDGHVTNVSLDITRSSVVDTE